MKIEGACHCAEIAYEAEVDPNTVGNSMQNNETANQQTQQQVQQQQQEIEQQREQIEQLRQQGETE